MKNTQPDYPIEATVNGVGDDIWRTRNHQFARISHPTGTPQTWLRCKKRHSLTNSCQEAQRSFGIALGDVVADLLKVVLGTTKPENTHRLSPRPNLRLDPIHDFLMRRERFQTVIVRIECVADCSYLPGLFFHITGNRLFNQPRLWAIERHSQLL